MRNIILCFPFLFSSCISKTTVDNLDDKSVKISNFGGSASAQIIEIGGAKYVVLVGMYKCAICPAVNQK